MRSGVQPFSGSTSSFIHAGPFLATGGLCGCIGPTKPPGGPKLPMLPYPPVLSESTHTITHTHTHTYIYIYIYIYIKQSLNIIMKTKDRGAVS